MKYFNKKFAVLIFAVLIIFSIAPKTALAQYPVFVTNPDLIVSINATAVAGGTTAGVSTATFGQKLYEWAYKFATETLKRKLLDMMVDQIVNYIQGGGDPKFISDWPGFFRDAVDQAGGEFIQQIGLGQFCSSYGFLLKAAFIPIPFFNRTSCTLRQVGANFDAFLKNFQSGGWVAWQEMVLKPQNNIYGAYLMTWDQYEIQKSAAVKAAAAEAQAGKGFLSVKRCVEKAWTTKETTSPVCVKTDFDTGECVSYENKTITEPVQTGCNKYEIVTPGSVVGDLAAKAVGSDIDYIVNADDLAAYVSAITNAILNRMFSEGVGLLHSALSSSTGSGGGGGGGGGISGSGSSAQAQCYQLLGTPAYNDCINSIQTGTDIREFQKNYIISLINQDLAYQSQLLGAKQATLTVLYQSVDILKQLGTCQNSVPYALAIVQANASTTASQITLIQSDIIALQVKEQQIKSVTDITQIPPLYNQVAKVVNPTATQSLALAAQSETGQKQQEMGLYQQQLSSCQQEKQQ